MELTMNAVMPYVLNPTGVVDVEKVAAALMGDWPLTPAQRRRRLVAKLTNVPGCFRQDAGHFGYLPLLRTGSHVLQPLTAPSKRDAPDGVLWLPEVFAIWQPEWPHARPIVLRLPDGTRARLNWAGSYPYTMPHVSAAFQQWLQQIAGAGATAIDIRCLDGMRNEFAVEATTVDACDRKEASGRLFHHVVALLARHRRALSLVEIAPELLARGVYRESCAPMPLAYILMKRPAQLRYNGREVEPMPSLAPALVDLLAEKDREEMDVVGMYRRESGGLPLPTWHPNRRPARFVGIYRLQLTLQDYGVQRVVDISGDATLADVHNLIQALFSWDNDHVWVFSFVGRPGNSLVAFGPDGLEDVEPAAAWRLSDIGLEPRQTFHYVFDFGEWWVVTLTVQNQSPGVRLSEPLVVSQEGDAPPQYPCGAEDDEF